VAFSLFRVFGHPGTKLVSAPTEQSAYTNRHSTTRCPVLRKTMPTRRLIDQNNPMPYVNAASTDIRRWK
jgi:hypothetical protein